MSPTASPWLGRRTRAARLLACAIRRCIPVRIDQHATRLKPGRRSLHVVRPGGHDARSPVASGRQARWARRPVAGRFRSSGHVGTTPGRRSLQVVRPRGLDAVSGRLPQRPGRCCLRRPPFPGSGEVENVTNIDGAFGSVTRLPPSVHNVPNLRAQLDLVTKSTLSVADTPKRAAGGLRLSLPSRRLRQRGAAASGSEPCFRCRCPSSAASAPGCPSPTRSPSRAGPGRRRWFRPSSR